MSPVEAHELISAGSAVLIDVRERNEWIAARIPGAELLPMSQINDWYTDLPQETTIIVQCQTGQRSASVVAVLMAQAGMDNVANLGGGIVAWDQAALPVDVGPEN